MSARAAAALGRLAFQAGDHEEAVEQLERALASTLLPAIELGQVRDVLGRALALLARFEEALAVFERALGDARAGGDEAAVIRFSSCTRTS